MFEYRVKWYNDINDSEESARGLVYGPSYSEAIERVIKDYGEDCIIDIYLQALEDEDTIELVAIKDQFNL